MLENSSPQRPNTEFEELVRRLTQKFCPTPLDLYSTISLVTFHDHRLNLNSMRGRSWGLERGGVCSWVSATIEDPVSESAKLIFYFDPGTWLGIPRNLLNVVLGPR